MLSQAERPAPETVSDLRPANSSNKTQTFFVGGLFVLAVLYTLYLAADFLLPVFLAAFVGLLLAPVVKLLKQLRIPVFIGSAIESLAVDTAGTIAVGPLQQLAQTSQSVNLYYVAEVKFDC
jgi:predicted PurR-regulated permease PerM